jgi:predicted phosphodiesterase
VKRTVVISDLQAPYFDRKAVDAVSEFIEDYRPDVVACVGDEADLPQISRWSRGTKGEFSGDIAKHRDSTVEVLRQLKVQHLSRSNHGDRLWTSISTRLPGLMGLPELEYETFFRHEELGITFHREPYKLAKANGGIYLMHGDEGSMSKHAGSTAAGLSARIGSGVVCGHTHRLGLVPVTEMVGAKVQRIRWAMEVGHLIDIKTSGMAYMKGMANWQQGFGILIEEGNSVVPIPVPIVNKSFIVDGVRYSW